MKLVHGVGYNDKTRIATINRDQIREYSTWKGMIKRCYCDKYKKLFPTYDDCFVSENFKSYSYFYDWYQQQSGASNKKWQLDKDLLIKNNKIYSEDTCVFLPEDINTVIRLRTHNKGDFPIGVSVNPWSGRLFARIKKGRKTYHIGTYDDPNSAFLAYKREKELYIKELANAYVDELDERAYEMLMKFEVNIDD